jgi:hypothetical protein
MPTEPLPDLHNLRYPAFDKEEQGHLLKVQLVVIRIPRHLQIRRLLPWVDFANHTCIGTAAQANRITADDDALNHAAFDSFVSSVIEHGSADIGVIGQPLRLLKGRAIF